jgi:hypothetical protein
MRDWAARSEGRCGRASNVQLWWARESSGDPGESLRRGVSPLPSDQRHSDPAWIWPTVSAGISACEASRPRARTFGAANVTGLDSRGHGDDGRTIVYVRSRSNALELLVGARYATERAQRAVSRVLTSPVGDLYRSHLERICQVTEQRPAESSTPSVPSSLLASRRCSASRSRIDSIASAARSQATCHSRYAGETDSFMPLGHDDGGYLIATVYTKLRPTARYRTSTARDGRFPAAPLRSRRRAAAPIRRKGGRLAYAASKKVQATKPRARSARASDWIAYRRGQAHDSAIGCIGKPP